MLLQLKPWCNNTNILCVPGLWSAGLQFGSAEQRLLQRRGVRQVSDRVDEREATQG